MIRYLLGELGEEERREVQERLFRDDEFFGRLCEAEDDLVDAWARGELDPARRSRFESHYLASSERRRKASAAEALARVSSVLTRGESSRGGIRMPSWALAAASVAVAVGLGALARETLRLREQIASLERRGSAEPEAARTAPAAPPVFTVFLLPGVARRAGAAAPLVIPGSAELVQMQLRIDPGVESPRFNATLAWASGARLWDQSNLEPSPAGAARLVRFWIPGSILRPGDYEVALTAPGQSQPVAFYYFSVR
jgi:hypothetical protein